MIFSFRDTKVLYIAENGNNLNVIAKIFATSGCVFGPKNAILPMMIMSNLRLNNTIYLMHTVTNAYARRHGLSRQEFLAFDDKYHVLNLIARCPDVFDPMTEDEMVEEVDAYVSQPS